MDADMHVCKRNSTLEHKDSGQRDSPKSDLEGWGLRCRTSRSFFSSLALGAKARVGAEVACAAPLDCLKQAWNQNLKKSDSHKKGMAVECVCGHNAYVHTLRMGGRNRNSVVRSTRTFSDTKLNCCLYRNRSQLTLPIEARGTSSSSSQPLDALGMIARRLPRLIQGAHVTEGQRMPKITMQACLCAGFTLLLIAFTF